MKENMKFILSREMNSEVPEIRFFLIIWWCELCKAILNETIIHSVP